MDAFGGIFGLIILALDIWAIISIVRSDASGGKKVLWILLIVILPVLGLILWGIMGPRGNRIDDRSSLKP
ncbi:PLD nuclease N-terminal domain-containing protein [Stutzerimonas azotifigens]|uniref:PLD nuclease N-terminal domain-containing protein n=1 Tax=Stutzerimonas azotifigens TaxID=291995 RepID=UPI0004130214|nr:PLD nuclease N-terminal domain-containing protein [Stutzerimonas azotifigens]